MTLVRLHRDVVLRLLAGFGRRQLSQRRVGAHPGDAPLQVGQHVLERLGPVLLRVELDPGHKDGGVGESEVSHTPPDLSMAQSRLS